MLDAKDWKWFGTPGHFIASKRCCFHLHTRVGNYRVSTVGCYHPAEDVLRELPPRPLGLERLYETMVFRVHGEGQGEVPKWESVDSMGYMTQEHAERCHVEFCEEYTKVARAERVGG